jgi:hypothetical protein
VSTDLLIINGPGVVARQGEAVVWAESTDLRREGLLAVIVERLDEIAAYRLTAEEYALWLIDELVGPHGSTVPALAFGMPDGDEYVTVVHGWGRVTAPGGAVTAPGTPHRIPLTLPIAVGRADLAVLATGDSLLNLTSGIVPGGAGLISGRHAASFIPRHSAGSVDEQEPVGPEAPELVSPPPPPATEDQPAAVAEAPMIPTSDEPPAVPIEAPPSPTAAEPPEPPSLPVRRPGATTPPAPGAGPSSAAVPAAEPDSLFGSPPIVTPPRARAVPAPPPLLGSSPLAPPAPIAAGAPAGPATDPPSVPPAPVMAMAPVHQPETPITPSPMGSPAPGAASQSPAPPGPRTTIVSGVTCQQDHFNNPAAPYCRVCGMPLHQQAPPVQGERPPLGLLVCDDGTTYGLDGDYAIGADPRGEPGVISGLAEPLVLGDGAAGVAPTHVIIHVDGWEVMALNRSPGLPAAVLHHGDAQWTPLLPGQWARLAPGSYVGFAGRHVAFETAQA